MRTVIHIGSDKTGTTSLQMRFANCRTQLAARGIVYPDIDGRPDHLGLVDPPLTLQPFDVEGEVLVLSSEAFWPLRPDRITALLEQMPPGTIEIIAYLREPGSFAEAAFLQRCQMCATERELFAVVKLLVVPARINPIVKRSILRLRQLRQWLNISRDAEVTVRPYAPTRWDDGDVLTDFCTTAGIANTIPILSASPIPRQNRTLNLNAIHASVLVRERFGLASQVEFLRQLDARHDELRPAGMYTSDRLRAHLRHRAEPMLSELDQRFGDLSSSLSVNDRPQIPAKLDRRQANALAAKQ